MRFVEITAGQDPSDTKLQTLAQAAIADDWLELADIYEIADAFSSHSGEDVRPSEDRQTAIAILEPLVTDNPHDPEYRRMLTRAQSDLDKGELSPREAKQRAIALLERLIIDNPKEPLYPRLLNRARTEFDKDDHVPNEAKQVSTPK